MTIVLENNTVDVDRFAGSSEGFEGQPPVTDDPDWWYARLDEIRALQERELPEDYEPVTAEAIEKLTAFMNGLADTRVYRRFPIFPLEDGGFRLQFRRGGWIYSALIRSQGPDEYHVVPVRGPGSVHYEAHTVRHLVAAFGFALVGYAD